MSPQRNEFHDESREVSRLLTQLASQVDCLEPSDFLRAWDNVEPRVLSCLRQTEYDEGAASGRIERLRNLTAEVGAAAKTGQLRTAALSRLAQSFGIDIAVGAVGGAGRTLPAADSRWLPQREHDLRSSGAPAQARVERTRGSATY
jgi:hypothetical protein